MQRNPLPMNFVVSEPIPLSAGDFAVPSRYYQSGTLIGARKHAGRRIIAEVCSAGRVRFFMPNMREVGVRLNYLRDEINALELSEGTLLIGDLVMEFGSHPSLREDAQAVGAFLDGSFESAQVALGRGPLPMLYVYNVIHGFSLEGRPYGDTLRWLQDALQYGFYVRCVEQVFGPPQSMLDTAVANSWEGVVLYDASYKIACRAGRGKLRVTGCFFAPVEKRQPNA